jgi:hypothetical protein
MWRGLVVVLAKASWPAADRLPRHLEDLLGPDWVAVAGDPVIGVEGIAATMAADLSLGRPFASAARLDRRPRRGSHSEG